MPTSRLGEGRHGSPVSGRGHAYPHEARPAGWRRGVTAPRGSPARIAFRTGCRGPGPPPARAASRGGFPATNGSPCAHDGDLRPRCAEASGLPRASLSPGGSATSRARAGRSPASCHLPAALPQARSPTRSSGYPRRSFSCKTQKPIRATK